ncbi:MAG: D-aminoacyl-tRNA deacylase [Planctomycetota bacterium]
MKIVLQRVSRARVTVEGRVVGEIGPGLLALVGIHSTDDEVAVEKLARRTSEMRIFKDAEGKMNLDVRQAGGAVLAVSQFTLCADTSSGRRPSFTPAMAPDRARPLFERYVDTLKALGLSVSTGMFGASMQVELVNDGPVTILLETS